MMVKSTRGFSLVGVMVSMSLTAGIALLLAVVTEQMGKLQGTGQTSLEFSSEVSYISQILHGGDRTRCSKIFQGLPIPTILPTNPKVRNIRPRFATSGYHLRTPAAKAKLGQSQIFMGNYRPAASGSVDVDVLVTAARYRTAGVSTSYGTQNLEVKMTLNLLRDPSGAAFLGCNGDLTITPTDEMLIPGSTAGKTCASVDANKVQSLCSDANGCVVRIITQNKITGEIRRRDDFLQYQQPPPSTSSSGWVASGPLGNSPSSFTVGGPLASQRDVVPVFGSVQVRNYLPNGCPGMAGNGPTSQNPYQMHVMVDKDWSARIQIEPK